MEEQFLKVIESTLDSLDQLTIWLFSSFIIVLISLFSSKEELTFGSFTINKKYAGAILYLMLCGLTFNIFKLLNNLSYSYNELLQLSVDSTKQIENAKFIIHTHNWVFNPFSQTNTEFSPIVDNVGYPMLIIIWWLGNALAQATLSAHNKVLRLFGIICAGMYLLFGLGCMMQIGLLTKMICDDPFKNITPFAGILFGGLLFFIINIAARKYHENKTTAHSS